MRILCVHAHFDDFEFVASGTFELWRRRLGSDLRARVLVCGDGKAGHQFRTREETGLLRLKEQEESARLGSYEFQLLRLPNGQAPREACLSCTPDFLAALWKAIRDFQPDYLVCPPLATDPLVGIHSDHQAVAEAVRRVAYMINVPHAFTPEYPADETQSEPCPVPVILNVYDSYFNGENPFDLAVNVEGAFEHICRVSFCHQSQLVEWLPWVGRHQMQPPRTFEEWSRMMRERLERRNRELGLELRPIMEVFTVTAWGEVPTLARLEKDWPDLARSASNLDRLRKRLARWRGDGLEQ